MHSNTDLEENSSTRQEVIRIHLKRGYNNKQDLSTLGQEHNETTLGAHVTSRWGSSFQPFSSELFETVTFERTKEVEWYLETYPVQDSFAELRAQNVEQLLKKHGRILLENLFPIQILPPKQKNCRFILKISTSLNGDPKSTNNPSFFWEILEDTELWQKAVNVTPLSVTVIMVHSCTSSQQSLVNENDSKIVAVTARTAAQGEIPCRMITRCIQDAVKQNASCQTNFSMHIVRPGSFDTLQTHLQQRSYGYYKILHLDLHGGLNDQNQAVLFFVKVNSKLQIQPDPINVGRLARLLLEHGITFVVLNACKSAAVAGASSNLAQLLVQAGIRAVVGMRFNVLSRSAEILVSSFYKNLLSNKFPITTSIALARAQLRADSLRDTRFGESIQLLDYIVPSIHCCEDEADMCISKDSVFQDAETTPVLFPSKGLPSRSGYEDEIFSLETIIPSLSGTCINIIGPIGIGKTHFLEDIEMWWLETGMINHSIFVDKAELASNMSTGTSTLAESLSFCISSVRSKCSSPESSSESCAHRLLVIVDDLDELELGDSVQSERHRKSLRLMIKKLQNISWIFSSRRDLVWLKSVAVPFELTGFNFPNAMNMASRLATFSITSSGATSEQETRYYFEEFILICRGNPLAIRMLMDHLNEAFGRDEVCSMKALFDAYLNLGDFHVDQSNLPDRTLNRYLMLLDGCLTQVKVSPTVSTTNQASYQFPGYLSELKTEQCCNPECAVPQIVLLLALAPYTNLLPMDLEPLVTTMYMRRYFRTLYNRERAGKMVHILATWAVERRTSVMDQVCDFVRASNLENKEHEGVTSQLLVAANYKFSKILREDLYPWLEDPHITIYGDGPSVLSREMRCINPVLTFILRSILTKRQDQALVREDLRHSFAMQKFHEDTHWLKIPYTTMEQFSTYFLHVDDDFVNFLSCAVSSMGRNEWTGKDHWVYMFVLSGSSDANARRETILAFTQADFARFASTYLPEARTMWHINNPSDDVSQNENASSRARADILFLELASIHALFFAFVFFEYFFLPTSTLVPILEVLGDRPLLGQLKHPSTQWKQQLAACYRVAKTTERLTFDNLLEAVNQLIYMAPNGSLLQGSEQDTLQSIPSLMQSQLDAAISKHVDKPGERRMNFEKELLEAQNIRVHNGQIDPHAVITNLESMLQNEVETTNNAIRKVVLFFQLATYHTRLGHTLVATSHEHRAQELLSTFVGDQEFSSTKRVRRFGRFRDLNLTSPIFLEKPSDQEVASLLSWLEKLHAHPLRNFLLKHCVRSNS